MNNNYWEYFILLKNDEKIIHNKLCAIYILDGVVEFFNNELKISAYKNNFIRLSGSCTINSSKGRCLIATSGFSDKNSIAINSEKDLYIVKKPWGNEIWLNHKDENYNFVMKSIYINKGHRTSLQVHDYKHECMYMEYGDCLIYYCDEEKYSASKEAYNIKTKKFLENTFASVNPGEIHRLEALSDIHLIEISSKHLDDVIRIQDDTLRSNGRVEDEHR